MSKTTTSAKSSGKKGASRVRSTTLNDPKDKGTHNAAASPEASRSHLSKQSTAIGGPGPRSATNPDGSFKGKPGEDIQMREPLSPAETRNAVAGVKVETNMSRAQTNEDGGIGSNDMAVVPPADVDKDAQKNFEDAKKAAAKSEGNPHNAKPSKEED